MPNPTMKKAPALAGVSGAIEPNQSKQRKESVNTSLPEFSSNFDIRTSHARIQVQSEADYWRDSKTDYAAGIAERGGLVRLTDDGDSHILLSPAEALSVAAALQAVAVFLMEEKAAA